MHSVKLKKSLGAFLDINDRDLFKGLRDYKLETQLGKTQKYSKERKVNKIPCNIKHILENYQSCVLSPRIHPGRLIVAHK